MAFRDLVGSLLGAPNLPDEMKERPAFGGPIPFVPPWQTGRPMFSDWDDRKAIEQGLKSSAYLYRGITMIAKAASSVPWKAFMNPRGTGSQRQPIPGHQLEQILSQPMKGLPIRPKLDGGDLFESIVGYLMLAGKSGIYLGDLKRNGQFGYMRPMMPYRMNPVLHAQRGIDYWKYWVDGIWYDVPVEAVWYTRFIDPNSEWDGLSPVKAIAKLVDTDVESVIHNYWTMKNSAVASGALISKNPMTPQAREANRREWQQSYGGKNRGKTPVLDGGEWDYIRLGMTPHDLLLVEQRKLTANEIASGLGVPPELMGMAERKYGNFGEARRHFWEDTIVPLILDLKSSLNGDLSPRWDDRLELEPDFSQVPALQEDRDAKEKRILARVAGGVMKINKAQEELGMEPDPKADVYLQSYHQVATPDYATIDETPALLPRAATATAPAQAPLKGTVAPERKAIDPVTEVGRLAYWNAWDAMIRRMTGALGQEVWAELNLERDLFLKGLGVDGISELWEATLEEVLVEARPRWVAMLTGSSMATVEEFGPSVFSAIQAEAKTLGVLGDAVPTAFNPYDQAIQQYIARHVAENVTQIEETTRKALKQIIGDGWANGDSILQLAARMAKMPEFSIARGETIAMTEMVALANYASRIAAGQSGVTVKKRWLSSRDARVRETHDIADETYSTVGIPLGQPFQVGNSLLMSPGDGSLGAEAKELINCRCTLLYAVQTAQEQ